MLRNRPLYLLLLIGVVVAATACDNVGRAFDPDVDPPDPGGEFGISTIQVVPVGGDARSGRPTVRATYPEGSGWPSSVPIVVEFSESLNEQTILPTTATGTDARIGVRVQGSAQLLPAQYDFLGDGRLLVIRPINGLQDQGGLVYEVVMFPEGRDVDGLRFLVSDGETILSDFQVNQDESITDGSIVATYPRDNFSDQAREGDFLVVFDRPVNVSSLEDVDIFLQPEGGPPIDATIRRPLSTLGVEDPRVVSLEPDSALLASQGYEFTVTANITFGQEGNLDFNGSTPFTRFTSISPSAPTSIELGSAAPGFPNKINRQNVLSVILNVDVPGDTLAGDVVVGRIYGGDKETSETFDLAFVESTASAPVAGEQTIMLDFGAQLGTMTVPLLDDGDVVFAAQIQRGSQSTGFIHEASNADPTFDITPPTLVRAGPPGSGNDIFTESESLSYYGEASEGLADATLVDGVSPTAVMFGSSNSGRFLLLPVGLGRITAARDYSLTLTDLSGNLSETSVSGAIQQRGMVTGVLSGFLTVEAYDHATLEPIVGATVLVDPPTPTVPATSQLIGTTDVNGRVTFDIGSGSAHTITIVRAEYDLVTIADTRAAFVSLPLKPVLDYTAVLGGSAFSQPTASAPIIPGSTVIVGSTAFADQSVMGISSLSAMPTAIPPTPILPNRVQIVTAFGGPFEPTVIPTYGFQACQICGTGLAFRTAPPAPAEPGGSAAVGLVLTPVIAIPGTLIGTHSEDFGQLGLDTANLITDSPKARVTSSLIGFDHQALTGIGIVTLQAGTVYDVTANFSLPVLAGLAGFAPVSWLVTEAEDNAGRISRVRVLLDVTTGAIFDNSDPLAIPTITAPGGVFSGSPLVSVADVLDAAVAPLGAIVAFLELTATDSEGRRWHVIRPDRDVSGGTGTIQFPDLVTANVAGLAAGAWEVVAEARIVISVTLSTADDFVLTERFRQEVNYSRAAPVTFTVN
jgi:hypothetical protein